MGYHQHSLAKQWEEAARGFPAERLGFKGKARDLDPGFPIYEAGGGEASCSRCGSKSWPSWSRWGWSSRSVRVV